MFYFVMTVGIPGSGKSTLAEELAVKYNAIIHSSDAIRKEFSGDEGNQEKNEDVFNTLHQRIKNDLMNGYSVIYDACNISYRRRMAFLREVSKFNPRTVCCVAAKSYNECVQDNSKRNRTVPDDVIRNMIKSFWVPQYYEGWDEIRLFYTGNPTKQSKAEIFNSFYDYDQETPYHSSTLGSHMLRTQTLLYGTGKIDLSKSREDQLLHVAAMWHDMGKPFCKTFINKKGNTTDKAHYYGHANASAYEFLVMSSEDKLTQESILGICNYIQWHMNPYNLEKYGGKEKFIGLVGREFYERLMLLHMADKEAH